MALEEMLELMNGAEDVVARLSTAIGRKSVTLIHSELCVDGDDSWSILHATLLEHRTSALGEQRYHLGPS